MRNRIQDIRYALRLFSSTPGFTCLAVLCLALGIGVNASIFSLLDYALFKQLPVFEPDRLVTLSRGGSGLFSYPDYRDLRDRAQSSELAAFTPTESSLEYERDSHLIGAEAVSANYHAVLGVGTALGKWFESDTEANAVISYSAWQRWFHGDPAVIGKLVRAETTWYTVVGVAPRDFAGAFVPLQTGLWIPFRVWIRQYPKLAGELENRAKPRVMVLGRLRNNATPLQSAAEFNIIAGRSNGRIHLPPIQLQHLEGFADQSTRRGSVRIISLLMTVVGLVLLIACMNVGNLLLARSVTRRQEISVRLALGATRSRIVSQLMTESVLLALAGGAVGLLLGHWANMLLSALLPGLSLGESLRLNLSLDARVLVYTAALSLVTAVLFGLTPAWRISRIDIVAAINGASQAGSGFRLRQASLAGQVGVSLVLLLTAGLFLRSFVALRNADPGFGIRNRIYVTTYISTPEFNAERGRQFYSETVAQLKNLPNVRNAGLTYLLPLTTIGYGCVSTPLEKSIPATDGAINPSFLPTMAMPLLTGRNFSPLDSPNSPPVVIVNQTLARRLWPKESAIGKHVLVGCDDRTSAEIVGVVKDFKVRSLTETPHAHIYRPFAQRYTGLANIVIETEGNTNAAIGTLRNFLLHSSAGLRIFQMGTLRDYVNASFWQIKWEASLLAGFGMLALLLASVGLYGVIAYHVTARTREIGIRMAIGAQRRDVFRLVLRQGLALTLIGVVLGLLLAVAVSRLVATFLYGVSGTDPLTYTASAALWIGISLLACLLPARRAARVDPVEALRHQ